MFILELILVALCAYGGYVIGKRIQKWEDWWVDNYR